MIISFRSYMYMYENDHCSLYEPFHILLNKAQDKYLNNEPNYVKTP
jgi:hypothetical protein